MTPTATCWTCSPPSPRRRSFAARELLGKDYLRNFQSFLGASGIDDWWAEAEAAARATLVKLGLPWDPRVAHAAFAPGGFDVRGPLVDETKPASEELTLDDDRNYLAIFTDKRLSWSDLRTENYWAPRGTGRDDYRYRTLLYLVARHALLAEYAAAAWRILVADGVVQRGGRLEPELVDVSGQTDTIWRLLAQPAPRSGGRPLGEYLDDPNTARTTSSPRTSARCAPRSDASCACRRRRSSACWGRRWTSRPTGSTRGSRHTRPSGSMAARPAEPGDRHAFGRVRLGRAPSPRPHPHARHPARPARGAPRCTTCPATRATCTRRRSRTEQPRRSCAAAS